MASIISDLNALLANEHLQGLLGYGTILSTIAVCAWFFQYLSKRYQASNRLLSTRHGVQRHNRVIFFLGLAGFCVFVITTLKVISWRETAEKMRQVNFHAAKKVLVEGGQRLAEDVAPFVDGVKKLAGRDVEDIGRVHVAADQPVAEGESAWPAEIPDTKPGRMHVATTPNPQDHPYDEQSELEKRLNAYFPVRAMPFFQDGTYERRADLYEDPGHFWWVVQWRTARLAWAVYLGNEARLRHPPSITPLLLFFLAEMFGMSGTHCLLNAYILLSPVREPKFENWTPSRTLLLVPTWLYVAVLALMPHDVGWNGSMHLTRSAMLLATVSALAPAYIAPRRLGHYYASAGDAKKVRAFTFALLALPMALLSLYASLRLCFAPRSIHDDRYRANGSWWNKTQGEYSHLAEMGKAFWSTFTVLGGVGHVSAMAWDVLLTGLVLSCWVVTAETEPRSMLRCSLLPWLKNEEDVKIDGMKLEEQKILEGHEKRSWLKAMNPLTAVTQLTRFARPGDGPASGSAEVPIRKRGRPTKHRKSESENESGYAFMRKSRSPPSAARSRSPAKRQRSESRKRSRSRSTYNPRNYYANSVINTEDQAAGWESAGLVWCLGLLGGLGMASVAVFGAEAAHVV